MVGDVAASSEPSLTALTPFGAWHASMSRKGNRLDSAVLESFLGHFKVETFHRIRFTNVTTFVAAVRD